MKKLNLALGLSALLAMSISCATAAEKSSHRLDYKTEILSAEKTAFRGVWVKQKEELVRVSGKLRLKSSDRINIPKYVEISVLDGSGKELESQKVRYIPRRFASLKPHHEVRFAAYLETEMQNDYSIQLQNVD